MYGKFQEHLQAELASIKEAGLYKNERNIASAQSAEITLQDGSKALNFCANNYLGLADSPRLIEAAKKAMDERGFGMSSVRFICGTQDLHKELEAAISDFFHTEDTILYASCFDANGGVFEPLLTADDAIISDSLNHASIIDGVRLCYLLLGQHPLVPKCVHHQKLLRRQVEPSLLEHLRHTLLHAVVRDVKKHQYLLFQYHIL